MIDALTINFVLVILTSVYFLMSVIIYRVRKEKYLLYYLFTFLTLAITYIMLFFQKSFPDWINFILTNTLVMMSQMFVVAGIRVLYQLKPFEKRFWISVLSVLTFLYYFTYIDFSLNFRIIVLSIGMAVNLIDLLLVVRKTKTMYHLI